MLERMKCNTGEVRFIPINGSLIHRLDFLKNLIYITFFNEFLLPKKKKK